MHQYSHLPEDLNKETKCDAGGRVMRKFQLEGHKLGVKGGYAEEPREWRCGFCPLVYDHVIGRHLHERKHKEASETEDFAA